MKTPVKAAFSLKGGRLDMAEVGGSNPPVPTKSRALQRKRPLSEPRTSTLLVRRPRVGFQQVAWSLCVVLGGCAVSERQQEALRLTRYCQEQSFPNGANGYEMAAESQRLRTACRRWAEEVVRVRHQ